MTDTPDNTNEEHVLPVHATRHPNAIHAVGADDFTDDGDEEMESDNLDSINGDLTPNDIFGLDPLDVLTLEEVAEYLKVSPAAARRAMKEQNLPGRNIGGEFRFLRDAVANWLRGQEAPAVEQQKARDDYSKSKPDYSKPKQDEGERFSRPPRSAYQSESNQSEQSGEYRPRQRYSEGGQQYGNQYGRRGGQAEGGGQYGGGQYGGGQQGGGQYGSSQYGGGSEGGGSYSRPPRRPFRPADGGGQEGYGGGGNGGGGNGGYGGDATGGTRFGGGGYAGGGQRFGGGPKRKNKRQVFDNERGKRLDRRKEGDTSEGQE